MKLRKPVVDEIIPSIMLRKNTDTGFEELIPVNDKFTMPIQIGFNDDGVRVANLDFPLTKSGDAYIGILPLQEGWQRTVFAKKGDAYSSVSGDTFKFILNVPVMFQINKLGTQVVAKECIGYDWEIPDIILHGQDFVNADVWGQLSADEQTTLTAIHITDLQKLPTTFATPFNEAIRQIVAGADVKAVYVAKYAEVATETYSGADIELWIGQDYFHFDSYGFLCKGENGIMIKWDYKDELFAELEKLGYTREE